MASFNVCFRKPSGEDLRCLQERVMGQLAMGASCTFSKGLKVIGSDCVHNSE